MQNVVDFLAERRKRRPDADPTERRRIMKAKSICSHPVYSRGSNGKMTCHDCGGDASERLGDLL